MKSLQEKQFRTIQQQVYLSILRSIVELEIPPGEKLTIERLKTKYAVSSTPIRGALYKLIEDGLIVYGPSMSFYAKKIDEEEVTRLFSVRRVLEQLALKESIYRIEGNAISQLIVRMRKHLAEPEETKKCVPYEIDYQLHQLILRNCENNYLMDMMKKISTLITRTRNVIKYYLPEKQSEWIINEMEEHLKIAESILERNLDKASEILDLHIDHSKEIICSILASSNVDYREKKDTTVGEWKTNETGDSAVKRR